MHCHGHDRGIASVVWQVTLKYMGALIGRQCHGHARDKSVGKKMHVAVTVDLHPRTCMHVLGGKSTVTFLKIE